MKSRFVKVRRARPLLGTFVEIAVSGAQREESHHAIDAAFAGVEEVQRRMNFHDATSCITSLNNSAHHGPVAVDEWTYTVLTAAHEIWRISDGAFDVTMGPRSHPADVNTTRHSGSFVDVELLPERKVRFHHPGVRIDLGGIAKGFAVDCAVEILQQHGISSGIVNAGGDLRAFGEAAPVWIRHPRDPAAALATGALQNAALATSARDLPKHLPAARTSGLRLDPKTGHHPHRIWSATVRAGTAMVADALTKVVMLRGEEALPVLNHFRADAIFIAAEGGVRCSPGWNAPFSFSS